MAFGATVPDVPDLPIGGGWGVFAAPPNPQFQRRKIDLCSYGHPNYFSKIVPGCI